MKKAVIIEGPDNLGKTTLACLIQKEFALHDPTIEHCGPPEGDGDQALEYQLKYLATTMKSFHHDDGLEIWDRSIIGECVYGPMYREYDHDRYEMHLVKELESIESRLFNIVLYTNGDVYKQMGIQSKADETKAYQTQKASPKIAIKFVDVFTKLALKHTLYINCENYESFDSRNKYILKRVRAWLNLRSYEHLHTGDFSHTFFNNSQMLWKKGIGFMRWRYECNSYTDKNCEIGIDHATISIFGKVAKRPTTACGASDNVKYIFVGEAPGQDGCGSLGIPFYDDRSGNLMQITLDRLGIHPTQYYMTNAVKCCPSSNNLNAYVGNQDRRALECVIALKDEVLRIMKKSPKAKVIAIGKVAGYELARFGIQHHSIYHPAYYLRMGISDEFYRALKMIVEEV